MPPSISTKEYAPLADEVNPPFGNIAPAPIVTNGAVVYSKSLSSGSNTPTDDTFSIGRDYKGKSRDLDEGDISQQNRHPRSAKGKERAWEEDEYAQPEGSYPPLNEEEEEERRIQANLAKLTARETARRKAVRTSRIMSPNTSVSTSATESASSSTASLPRSTTPRPLSILTEGISSKFMGKGKERNDAQEMELASPITANPYDPKPPSRSPTGPTSPFADPPGTMDPTAPMESPVGGGAGYAYGGTGWRASGAEEVNNAPVKERWWHSLCAWGSDLDGGHGRKTSNQAGRTNPFE